MDDENMLVDIRLFASIHLHIKRTQSPIQTLD